MLLTDFRQFLEREDPRGDRHYMVMRILDRLHAAAGTRQH